MTLYSTLLYNSLTHYLTATIEFVHQKICKAELFYNKQFRA
jgi:hypothetical protein